MARTKRHQNKCKSCGYTWYPRGKDLSAECPKCGSSEVSYSGCGCAGILGAIGTIGIVAIVAIIVVMVVSVVSNLGDDSSDGSSEEKPSHQQTSDETNPGHTEKNKPARNDKVKHDPGTGRFSEDTSLPVVVYLKRDVVISHSEGLKAIMAGERFLVQKKKAGNTYKIEIEGESYEAPTKILDFAVLANSPGKSERHPEKSEATQKLDKTYSIIKESRMGQIKRSVDVRLKEKLTSDQLNTIANEIRTQTPINFKRTFIVYYLPKQVVGAGGWATSHFNPTLKIEILGTPKE